MSPTRDATIDAYVYQQFVDRVIGSLGALEAQYQQVVNLASNMVEYHEALLRIISPQHGSLYPASFLLLIDQLGVMKEVTRWIVERALADIDARPSERVFVNLSAAMIGDETLIEHASEARERRHVGRGALGFEIQCDDLLAREREISGWLEKLRAAGFPVAIDRCNHRQLVLPELVDLPVDYVKFALSPHDEVVEEEIVEFRAPIAALSKAGKRVVALGIEDARALGAVQRAGFQCGQGYYFSKPSPGLLGPEATIGTA